MMPALTDKPPSSAVLGRVDFVAWAQSPAGAWEVVVSGANYSDLVKVMTARQRTLPGPWRVLIRGVTPRNPEMPAEHAIDRPGRP
jgi:hypothetical protein